MHIYTIYIYVYVYIYYYIEPYQTVFFWAPSCHMFASVAGQDQRGHGEDNENYTDMCTDIYIDIYKDYIHYTHIYIYIYMYTHGTQIGLNRISPVIYYL